MFTRGKSNSNLMNINDFVFSYYLLDTQRSEGYSINQSANWNLVVATSKFMLRS